LARALRSATAPAISGRRSLSRWSSSSVDLGSRDQRRAVFSEEGADDDDALDDEESVCAGIRNAFVFDNDVGLRFAKDACCLTQAQGVLCVSPKDCLKISPASE